MIVKLPLNISVTILYIFISIISVISLCYSAYIIRRYGNKDRVHAFLLISAGFSVLAGIGDVLYALRESELFHVNKVDFYIGEICFVSSCFLGAYFWFLASESAQKAATVRTRLRRLCVSIPSIVMIVFTCTTWFTNWFFYLEDGHYVRGPLMNVFTSITLALILKSCFGALIRSVKKKYYLQRKYFLILFSYSVIIVIMQLLQMFLGSIIPFIPFSAALVFILIQQRTIKNNIYYDRMAKCNNRIAMENYLDARFESAGEHFRFALIDMDNFKQINDSMGHSVGDVAIQTLSNYFKFSLPRNLFFARLGGDEFVVIGEVETEEEFRRILNSIRRKLEHAELPGNLSGKISFSYGISNKLDNNDNVPDLMKRADDNMYRQKQERHRYR